MKTKKYFIIPFLALLACSCQDEEQVGVQPTPGEDVKFGAGLEQNASRTIYGPKNDKGFPIYWVDGDEVIVSSPDCAENGGVGSATYKVHVESETQAYATSLDKTGEIGVRWGDNQVGNFYSVYPVSSSHTKLGSDYKTVTLTMPAQQDNNIVTEEDARIIRSDMRSCFMYAAEGGVNSGETVNLKYKPLSTALRFTLRGPQTGDPVTINYVRIYAPAGTYISGTYNVDLSTATDEKLPTMKIVDGLGRNYVTMNAADASTGAYLTLAQGEEIEMNAFLLIADNTVMTDEWYIEIGTSSGKSYKKYLDTSASDDNRTLVPGKVHCLSEALPPLTSDAWDASNWMVNLQRNVYLSEISIPGSWYSLNGSYQPDRNSISLQYGDGVRAFHFDTRWIATRDYQTWPPQYIYTVSDLGIADDGDTYSVSDGKYIKESGTTFASALAEVVNEVKDDEYMVVVCTFAQGSVNYIYGNNYNWIHKISEICNMNNYVYNGKTIDFSKKVITATSLNSHSTVADVLGKVVVIVNTFTTTPVDNSKCFFMNIPISQDEKVFTSGNYYKVHLSYNNQTKSDITMYGTHAQRTNYDSEGSESSNADGYIPTLSQRKAMVTEILDWSEKNYSVVGNNEHNIWMYLGMGGYIKANGILDEDHYSDVRDALNGFIGDRVEKMYSSNSFYPIGIVLMNDVHSSNTSIGYGLAQRILEMNNKYRKAYDPNRSPVDGSYIDGSNGVQSAAPGYSSGMKDNQTDAIGWTRCR